MTLTFNIVLALHVIGGLTGLLTGLYNIVRIKGDKQHVLVGKIFLYAMLTAGFSSLILAALHPNYFLFIVGVFTLYMTGTGSRYIHLKMLNGSEKPKPLDYAITYAMVLAGIVFIVFGIMNMVNANMFGLVFLTFGFLGLRFTVQDFNNYKGKSEFKNYWLMAHLQRMTGAFIAALTAFLVVNVKYFPGEIPSFIYWLLPTAVFAPLITKWTRKLRLKKKPTVSHQTEV